MKNDLKPCSKTRRNHTTLLNSKIPGLAWFLRYRRALSISRGIIASAVANKSAGGPGPFLALSGPCRGQKLQPYNTRSIYMYMYMLIS